MKTMKTFLLAACGLAMPLCLCAQEQGDVAADAAAKTAKVYAPEQGDFAIGFDVTPVLRYVGNFFNGNTNNTAMDNGLQGSPAMDGVFQGPVASIMAKYMLTDRMGLRANIGLLNRNTHTRLYVDNDVYSQLPHDQDVAGDAQLIDHRTVKVSGQYMNEVVYCHVKDYTMPQLAPSNPPNDYGAYKGSAQNHHYVIQNVVETLSNKGTITTNVLEGLKVVDIIERIYEVRDKQWRKGESRK